MYAVVKTGGKQYKLEKGNKLKVEKIEVNQGDSVDLKDVLMVNNGKDLLLNENVSTASVTCKVVKHFKGDKVIIFKKRRRKNSQVKKGHRQNYTLLETVSINI